MNNLSLKVGQQVLWRGRPAWIHELPPERAIAHVKTDNGVFEVSLMELANQPGQGKRERAIATARDAILVGHPGLQTWEPEILARAIIDAYERALSHDD